GLATINKTLDPVIEPVNTHVQLVEDSPPQRASLKRKKKSVDIPPDNLDKLVRMGYTKQQVTRAFSEVAKKSPNEETSSLWLSVLCRLREVEVYDSPLEPENLPKANHHASSSSSMHKDGRQTNHFRHEKATLASERGSEIPSSSMRPCSSFLPELHHHLISNLELDVSSPFIRPLLHPLSRFIQGCPGQVCLLVPFLHRLKSLAVSSTVTSGGTAINVSYFKNLSTTTIILPLPFDFGKHMIKSMETLSHGPLGVGMVTSGSLNTGSSITSFFKLSNVAWHSSSHIQAWFFFNRSVKGNDIAKYPMMNLR
nr:crossover junction endonuclease MUS81 [Tanacetum cinerariifolium]